MFDSEQIRVMSVEVRVAVDAIMCVRNAFVDKLYVIGSYASGTATDASDLDYLVVLKGKVIFPRWEEMQRIHRRLHPKIHLIFGTIRAQESLDKPYKEVVV